MNSFKLKINEYLDSLGFRISILISTLFLLLILILNFLVIHQSQNSFTQTIGSIQVNPIEGGVGIQKAPYDIIAFDFNGQERPKPLTRIFAENFQNSLFVIGIIGILLSFLIGTIVGQILSRSLNNINIAIKDIKNNNYKNRLELTGLEEFDNVIMQFNSLSDELVRVEDLRKDLIADTSHELKTPLTSIIGQLTAMQDSVLKPTKERISNLINEAERLNNLVERMQEFSRLRGKKDKLHKTEFLISELVEELIQNYAEKLNENNFGLINSTDSKFKIKADKNLLKQLLTNLIENSLRYSSGNRIEIEAKDKKIIFKDNGVGVPEESLNLIFERFYRVEKSRNRRTGGLGLGLSIVKEIAELHNWQIKAYNNNGLIIEITNT